jgi:3-hydroxyacyl-CoA dehydrogenase / 3-hydroxy-2-methylbutyryl-CoA dehydrogenase
MKIKNHTAVVSGGASGLGEATVRLLVENEARVLIIDQDEEKGRQLQRELGNSVLFVKTDVRDDKQVTEAIAKAYELFGAIHINVNCAGIAVAK